MLFLVEDNGYAISVPVECQTAGGSISRLVEGFPSLFRQEVDGTDFLASYRALREAVEYCRIQRRPALLHAHVIRPYSHSLSDDEALYKTAAERAAERERDPVLRFPRFLIEEGVLDRHALQRITHEIDQEVDEATQRALRAEAPSRDSVDSHLYSPDVDPTSPRFCTPARFTGEPATMVDLLNATLKEEMRRNPRVVVFGEDVADCSREENLPEVKGKGGVFKVTHGLQREFGRRARVQLPAGRSLHRGAGHRHGGAGLEAGGGNPVLRLHLAGHDADPRRVGPPCAGAPTGASPARWWCACPSAATSTAAPSTTASPARWPSPTCRDCGW